MNEQVVRCNNREYDEGVASYLMELLEESNDLVLQQLEQVVRGENDQYPLLAYVATLECRLQHVKEFVTTGKITIDQ